MRKFIGELPQQLKVLESAVTATDASAKQAHALNGASANLSADGLSLVAFELEKIGKTNDFEQASSR
ncbi:MAG: Hpt domain-containing protein [Gammaproteobacteria bacterium]|nr:Hpt domain-containing protein [Gammaproteobacteria bacterium]